MKRSSSLLWITAVLFVGLCIVLLRSVRTGTAPQGAPGSSSPPAVSASESAELAELRREIAQLRTQVLAQGQRESAGATPAPAPAQTPATNPELRAADERIHREYADATDAAFRNETTDPRWSSATSSVVQAAIAEDGELRSLARGVECRSRTCRVEITDDGSGKLGKLLPVLAQRVGGPLPSMVADRVDDGNGSATMVLYLSRREEGGPIAR